MTAQMMKLEVRDELLAIRREPATLFFSVLMPVLFFTMFLGLFGPEGATDAGIIAPYGTFAVLAVVMLSPGIGLADARDRGWLRVKRVSGIPLWMTLLAKVTAAIPYALAVLLALTVVAVTRGRHVGRCRRAVPGLRRPGAWRHCRSHCSVWPSAPSPGPLRRRRS